MVDPVSSMYVRTPIIIIMELDVMTNPLDGRNTKKLKNQKLKLLIFL